MKIKVNLDNCDTCGCCISVCPTEALQLNDKYLKVVNEKCISCGNCIIVCPVGALSNAE